MGQDNGPAVMIPPTTLRQQTRATRLYRKALRDGLLVPAATCEACGKAAGIRRLDGHHHNGYDDDHALDVVWLCRACHGLIHIATPIDKTVPPPAPRFLSDRTLSLAAYEQKARAELERLAERRRFHAAERRAALWDLKEQLGTWPKVAEAIGQTLPAVSKAAYKQPKEGTTP